LAGVLASLPGDADDGDDDDDDGDDGIARVPTDVVVIMSGVARSSS
jgi:hypothetical protein